VVDDRYTLRSELQLTADRDASQRRWRRVNEEQGRRRVFVDVVKGEEERDYSRRVDDITNAGIGTQRARRGRRRKGQRGWRVEDQGVLGRNHEMRW
jgi:ribonuclease HI